MGAEAEIKNIPRVVSKAPLMAIGIGLAFLILVLVVEAYKPGLLTGPIRHLLSMVGIGTGS